MLTHVHADPHARVLVVTNMWPHAENPKYGIFVKRQVDSLIDAGVPCDVYFIRGHRSPLAYVVAALRFAAWNLRSRGYRLVHAHGGEAALPARAYVRAPVLISYCGDDLLGTPRADGSMSLAHRVRRWLLRQHARMMSATLTKSRRMEDVLPAPVRRRNSVIPNGVDTEAFRPLGRDEARARLGWREEERVALFAADPEVERKRHWLAAAACERASGRLPGVRIEVASHVDPDRMPALMSAADCLLVTSVNEGSPNVVKEALMCDLPVVSTDVGDVDELLDGAEPSWICDDTPEALAEALIECLEVPRRSNGRAISGHLSVEAIADRVLDLYAGLAPDATLPRAGATNRGGGGLEGSGRVQGRPRARP